MPSIYDDQPIGLERIRSTSLSGRQPTKVSLQNFGAAIPADTAFAAWLDSLPKLLAADSLRELVHALVEARRAGRRIVWGLGGHVVKCGLAPVLLDLMRDGFVSALAMNGSAAIHDAEIALCGSTSEDVDGVLGDGSFGMAEETAALLQSAASLATREEVGLGEALGRELVERAPAGTGVCSSLLAGAYRARVPVTVHVAIGTDTPHMHPRFDAAAHGAASHRDFRLFCELTRQLEGGGAYLNVGSAVILPEVFLKAVTVVRNLRHPLSNFFTANFDFLQHYRPSQNVVRRPTLQGGKGFAFTGHHEIMIPLLAALLRSAP